MLEQDVGVAVEHCVVVVFFVRDRVEEERLLFLCGVCDVVGVVVGVVLRCLYECDVLVGEVVEHRFEKVREWDVVAVEHGDVWCVGQFECVIDVVGFGVGGVVVANVVGAVLVGECAHCI